jgi:hypothetical protein
MSIKLTSVEIIEIITKQLEPYEFGELKYLIEKSEDTELLSLGETQMVEDLEETTGEAWRVQYFKDHDVYIKQNGYYDSYESYSKYEEHDYVEVVPFEEVVISYKNVK